MRTIHHESCEQIAFSSALRLMERCKRFKHLKFFKFNAIPQTNRQSKMQGRRNKDLGYLAGFPDLSFFWVDNENKQHFGFIEFKARFKPLSGPTYKGQLSPAQKEFKADCEAVGIKYEVAYSSPEGFEILRLWGVTTQ